MYCIYLTSSTGSGCSSCSSHELHPPTGPSNRGIIGIASGLMPFGVMWWLRKWSSHIWWWSVISRSVSRKAASHTFTRALSLGNLKNLLRGRLNCSPGLRSLWFMHPWTAHFTIVATSCQFKSDERAMFTFITAGKANTMSRDDVWQIKWFVLCFRRSLYWLVISSDI